jgi:FdhE protein
VAGNILEPGQIEAAANKPPFIQLPPRDLFARRAARLEQIATEHPLADYLHLLAAVCRAQQQVLDLPLWNRWMSTAAVNASTMACRRWRQTR